MEVLLVLVVLVLGLAVAGVVWLLVKRFGERAKQLRRERERLDAVVAGHREMAAAHASSVDELAPKARAHREAAADHEQRADALEDRIERERREARFHEERAGETEDERGRI